MREVLEAEHRPKTVYPGSPKASPTLKMPHTLLSAPCFPTGFSLLSLGAPRTQASRLLE